MIYAWSTLPTLGTIIYPPPLLDGIAVGGASSTATSNTSNMGGGSIELYGSTPYIDFHYNNSTADYTSRIIASDNGRLLIAHNGTPAAMAYYSRSITPSLVHYGTIYNSSSIETPSYYLSNKETTGWCYYIFSSNADYGHIGITAKGTTSAVGTTEFIAGNSIASGTANNSKGIFYAYGSGSNWVGYGGGTATSNMYVQAEADRILVPKLRISGETDIGGTTSTSPPLTIGPLTGTHIEIDGNEILAKTNETTLGTLYLQDSLSGLTYVCSGGGLRVYDIPCSWLQGHNGTGTNAGIVMSDATDTGVFWPWIKLKNTSSGRMWGMGILNKTWYLVASATSRTANGYDKALMWNENGTLENLGYFASTLNGNTVLIGSQNTGYCHFQNSANIPFWFNRVIYSDGGFSIYNTGDNHWRNGYLQINKSDGGDCCLYLLRSTNADWRFLNSGGVLYIQCDWTNAKTSYYTVMQMDYNTRYVHIPAHLAIGGYNNTGYGLSANSAIINNWIRTVGNAGWYSESYGGGWYMTDTKWIRSYNNKPIYINIASNNTYGLGGHRLSLALNADNHNSIMIAGGGVMYGFCVNGNGNWYFGQRTNGSFESITNDAYGYYGDNTSILPNTDYAKYLGSDTKRWQGVKCNWLDAWGGVWGAKVRLLDNWVGFYAAAKTDTTRYGFILCNDTAMYFRKENGVGTAGSFNFSGDIYLNGNSNELTWNSSTAWSIERTRLYGYDTTGSIIDNWITNSGSTAAVAYRVLSARNTVSLYADANAGVYHTNSTGSSTAKWLIYINTSGTVTANTSDRRWKIDKGLLDDKEVYNILSEIPIINFIYKEDVEYNNLEQSGIYAQDLRDILLKYGYKNKGYLNLSKIESEEHKEDRNNVEYAAHDKQLSEEDREICQEWLTEDENENKYSDIYYDITLPEEEYRYDMNYQAMIPLLIKGWQIQQKQLEEKDKTIASLEQRIARLEQLIK